MLMARPTIFTPEVLQKLEQAFALDCTDEEACFYADISPSSLYAYQARKPKFLERKQALRLQPILKARMELVRGLGGNPELSLKYLERKRRDEFSPKQISEIKTDMTFREEGRLDRESLREIAREYEERFRQEIVDRGRLRVT